MIQILLGLTLACTSHAIDIKRRSVLQGGLVGWLGAVMPASPKLPAPSAPLIATEPIAEASLITLRQAQLIEGISERSWLKNWFVWRKGEDGLLQWARMNPEAAKPFAHEIENIREFSPTKATEKKAVLDQLIERIQSVDPTSFTSRPYIRQQILNQSEKESAREMIVQMSEAEVRVARRLNIGLADLYRVMPLVMNPQQILIAALNGTLDGTPYRDDIRLAFIEEMRSIAPRLSANLEIAFASTRDTLAGELTDRLGMYHRPIGKDLHFDFQYDPGGHFVYDQTVLGHNLQPGVPALEKYAENYFEVIRHLELSIESLRTMPESALRDLAIAKHTELAEALAEELRELPARAEQSIIGHEFGRHASQEQIDYRVSELVAQGRRVPDLPAATVSRLEWSEFLNAASRAAGLAQTVVNLALAAEKAIDTCEDLLAETEPALLTAPTEEAIDEAISAPSPDLDRSPATPDTLLRNAP